MSWPQETKYLNKSLLSLDRKAPEQPQHLILMRAVHKLPHRSFQAVTTIITWTRHP